MSKEELELKLRQYIELKKQYDLRRGETRISSLKKTYQIAVKELFDYLPTHYKIDNYIIVKGKHTIGGKIIPFFQIFTPKSYRKSIEFLIKHKAKNP